MFPPADKPKTTVSAVKKALLRFRAHTSVLCLLALIACLPLVCLQAQEPATADEVVKVSTDLLVFPVRIRDRRKPGAPALNESQLLLKDDDQATSGLYLYPGADRVALVFALDQSGSLRDIVAQQREAALALFGRFGERSQVAVIRFAERPALVAPFSRDMASAREAFKFPVRANQHTAIFDAAAAAVKAFEALPRVRSERRIAILISDGLDNASARKAAAVIQEALAKQVSFYVVHLPLFAPRDGRLAVRTPAKGFRDLAEKTGGKYFLAGDASSALAQQANRTSTDLTPVFQAIEEDLRSQYLLGFYAGEGARDGRKHRFTVSMPAGVEYQVAGRGYSRKHEFFVGMPGDARREMPR